MVAIELLRVVRHGVAPFVILAIEKGWLPKAAQSDAIEFIAILLSFGLAYGWSWWNERKRDSSVDHGKSDRAGGVRDNPGPAGSEGPGLDATAKRKEGSSS
jgi:hypothetical protein